MQQRLTVKIVPISELFSGPTRFTLPWFQRAYAWQTPQVGRLLTDLFDAMRTPHDQHFYMLGNFMLAQNVGTEDVAVIDGHQRIVSMTILFSALRDLEQEPIAKAALQAIVTGSPNNAGSKAQDYSLCPQSPLAEFFERYVQAPGATALEFDGDEEPTETERNIIENRDYFRSALTSPGISAQTRRNLADFVNNACHAVVRVADNEDNAWQMLQIEEETRLDFNATDRAKASLLGVMVRDDRDEAARIWDDCQYELGSKDTLNLLKAIRTLKRRRRSSAPLEKDICSLFTLDTSGAKFMSDVVKPASERLRAIREGTVSSGRRRAAIARSARILNCCPEEFWLPAAMRWLEVRGGDHKNTETLFSYLERVVLVQKIVGIEPPRQESRINRLLKEIDASDDPEAMTELEIEDSLRIKALNVLRKSFSRRKSVAAVILSRLSIELGNDPRDFNADQPPTLEHVLPQKPPPSSAWYERFPSDNIRREYVNLLGNLTLLTRHENQLVGNFDWSKKKSILAQSNYRISRHAAKTRHWTPEAIDARTEELIATLFKAWDLSVG